VTWGGGQPGGGFEDDESPRAPLLPPDDRVWRHPSEVGAALRGRARRVGRRARGSRPSRNWRVALLAGTIGGTLAAGLAAATDVFGTRAAAPSPPPRTTSAALAVSNSAAQVATSPGVARVGDGARQRLVLVHVGTEDGHRRATTGVVLSGGPGNLVVVPAAAVDDARSVTVATEGGRTLAGSVIGDDGDTGVSVVRVPGLASPAAGPIPEAVPTAARGQLVVAIALDPGAGGGLDMGVGTVREAQTQMTAAGRSPYLDVMEVDAPLPAGTPGGLVLDGTGTPIGLTLAVLGQGPRQRTYAAPLSVVRDSAGQLAATGHVVHAWLGVQGHDLDTKDAAGLGLPGGAEVTGVQPDSPAAGAGIQGNDVIGDVDGKPVRSMLELRAALRLHRPGDNVTLSVHRGNQERHAQATLGTEPPGH